MEEGETTKVGIVGAGQEKFDAVTAAKAQDFIRQTLAGYKSKHGDELVVISGGSPMKGVDYWAETIAKELGIKTIIFRPEVLQWNPANKYGYRRRNIDIVENSDVVYVIVPAVYPKEYKGYRFDFCYHCGKDANHGIKSGACWTGNRALKLKKDAHWIVI